MSRILLTDGEQRSALAVTRSLGRAGHHVAVCSAEAGALSFASRYCAASYVLDHGPGDPEAFLEELGRVMARERPDVVLPLTDPSIPLVLQLRTSHPTVRIPLPEAAVYSAISDKRHLMEVAGELGVPVPAQCVVEAKDPTAVDTAPEMPLPLVLKPARSAVHGEEGVRRFGVQIVHTAAEYAAALRDYPADAYPMLVQQLIEGPGLGAFALFWDGAPVAWFAHRRIREKPPTGGVSVCRDSVPLREDLRDYSTRILSRFGWNGVAMVEFKEDRRTGVPYLMEVNGRFWGSLQLAVDAGVDFPRLLIECDEGRTPEAVSGASRSVRSRWLLGELDHLIWLARNPTARRRAALPGPLGGLGRFLLWRPGDRAEVLRWSDPRPFAREARLWIRDVLGRER